ncbi:hypothetical protein [Rhizobium johnstonii]|uniref:hypothetical protein n=1 Tax=Rhizobium johnstonii TaxID=3019933 RepID=UPI003F9C84DB
MIPEDLLTEDTTTNRKAAISLSDLKRLGPLGDDFIDVLRSVQNDTDGTFREFAERLSAFLPKIVRTAAKSHPTCRDLAPEAFEADGIDVLRLAIAGIETDEALTERGWDVEDALADIKSQFQMLEEEFVVAFIGQEIVTDEYEEAGNSRLEAKRYQMFRDFVWDMRSFLDTIHLNRRLLAGREEDMERLISRHELGF